MSRFEQLTEQHEELIVQARDRLLEDFDSQYHTVAAAVQTSEGDVYTAMNFKHYAAMLCAEISALAVARSMTSDPIDTVVSVRSVNFRPSVINSCGRCVQVYGDLYPDIHFIVAPSGDEELAVVTAKDMLPLPYKSRERMSS